MRMKLPIWHNIYLLVVFLVVISWVFIGFPLVNISSGELKPRGLFVDENAINMHSTIYALIPPYVSPSNNFSNEINTCSHNEHVYIEKADIIPQCSSIKTMLSTDHNGLFFQCLDYIRPNGHVQQLIVDPLYSPKPLESTLLVFTLTPEQVAYTSVYALLGNTVSALNEARWQAKRVVILLVCAHSHTHREMLVDMWIREQNAGKHVYVGVIRHAYVVDYVHLHTPSPIPSPSHTSNRFSKIWCRYIGRYGVLPNMDMVAYLLIKFRGLITIPYIISYPSSYPTPYPPPWLQCIHKYIQDIKVHVNHPHFDMCIQRVYALVWSVYEHVYGNGDGSGDGIHSTLLAHNIDSVILQPIHDLHHVQHNVYGVGEKLYEVVMQVVHMCNNLEEELHHSMFFYLILDNSTFVGITEYGIPLSLGLVSFVIIFVQFSNKLYTNFSAMHLVLTVCMGVVVVLYACLASMSFSHALLFYLATFPVSYAISTCAAK